MVKNVKRQPLSDIFKESLSSEIRKKILTNVFCLLLLMLRGSS